MRRSLLGLDVTAVLAFVVLGKDTHGGSSSVTDVAATAAPFLIALVVGWALARAWRRPEAIATGAVVAGTTLVLGMAVRRLVFDDGTALTFVIVATGFLTATMLGWRALITGIRRVNRPGQTRTSSEAT